MRILAVSDVVDPVLYDHFDGKRWHEAGVDVLISCGDLPSDYLSQLASRFDRPLFYVPGNHDGGYYHVPPDFGQSIDGRLFRYNGLRILGLGGAPLHNGGTEQYGERGMALRILMLRPALWRLGGVDLVVTHAPPRFDAPQRHPPLRKAIGGRRHVSPSLHDDQVHPSAPWPDPGHRGFHAFANLIHTYRPRVLLHGHTHLGYGTTDRTSTIDGTRVIDVYGHCLVDM